MGPVGMKKINCRTPPTSAKIGVEYVALWSKDVQTVSPVLLSRATRLLPSCPPGLRITFPSTMTGELAKLQPGLSIFIPASTFRLQISAPFWASRQRIVPVDPAV